MSVVSAVYNERAWAIDLIGHLKLLCVDSNRPIKDAGGEQTIRAEGGSLFPDVLLFGDRASARILQGWELKMPDTSIDSIELRENAEAKADALGLDSYVLWNVTYADLYVRTRSGSFTHHKRWSELADVKSRNAVAGSRGRWESLAEEILGYVNAMFDSGALEGRQFIEAYKSGGVTSLIMENCGDVEAVLRDASGRDSRLRAEITVWWTRYRAEYAKGEPLQILSQAVLANWIGKILFAHILRERDSRANAAVQLDATTSPSDALSAFAQLSKECNFWTIFAPSLALELVPTRPWNQLKQFNSLLRDLRLGTVEQGQLSEVLEATVDVSVRKLRGQFPTPYNLARLLIALTVRNTHSDRVLDPCCGSGTIPRAALEQKLAAGVAASAAAAAVFAGDQDPQAVQISTFALAKPQLMRMPLRIFQKDAFSLTPDTNIEFRDPSNGEAFVEPLGQFEAIASNLPFVAQDGRAQYQAALDAVATRLVAQGSSMTGRADVAAYLPFALGDLLKPDGRMGVIITNAWLGTDWGDDFYRELMRRFSLRAVITSGAGRWFTNSKVVTNLLILENTDGTARQADHSVHFVVTKKRLEDWSDPEFISALAAHIELGQPHDDVMTVRTVAADRLDGFRRMGLRGNAQFVDCDWVLDLPLIPLSSLFTIRRGERRGHNQLFYPRSSHGIEPEYIRPLVKSPADFKGLTTTAKKEAFTCSRSEDELRVLGHTGALRWIDSFRKPDVIQKLERPRLHWYEMRGDSLSDMVMFINYGERLFVGRVTPPAFVDQRMIRLTALDERADIELCHALLNSTISLFFLEGIGFGRGLGALDLSKDRVESYFPILDPERLSVAQRNRVKEAFRPLLERDVLAIGDELDRQDRRAFDSTVIDAFQLEITCDRLYEAMRSLTSIRLAATN